MASEQGAGHPAVLSRFEPQGIHSTGSLGKLHRAIEKATGRAVAFRGFVRPAGTTVEQWRSETERYRRELAPAQPLDHPAIARLLDFGEDNGFFYVVSEWFDGEPLQALLARGEKFEPARALKIAGQAGRALEYSAEHRVRHGAVAPDTLLVSRDDIVRQTGFGLSPCRAKSDALYISPEELLGLDGDSRSDLFCLGLVLYRMLAGEHPFPGASAAEVQRAILSEPTPKLPGAEPHLQAILIRLLAKDPSVRYQNWGEVAADLVSKPADVAATRARPRDPMGAPVELPAPAPPSVASHSVSATDLAVRKSRRRERDQEASQVRRKRVARTVSWALAGLLLAGLSHALFRRAGEHTLVVAQVSGELQVSSDGLKHWRKVQPGERLKRGDSVRTGSRTEAVLAVGDGTRLLLRAKTTLTVRQLRQNPKSRRRERIFYLASGAMLAHVQHRPGQEFSIVTRYGRAIARGTEYAVAVHGDGAKVSTVSGVVEALNDAGKTQVASGEKVELEAGQAPKAATSLTPEDEQRLAEALKKATDGGLLDQLKNALAGFEDGTLMPVADQMAGIGESIGSLVSMKALKAGSARAQAVEAMQGLVYALETANSDGSYPATLNRKTLEELSGAEELRQRLLPRFKDQRLEYYKRLPSGYEIAARVNDEAGTLVVARNGKITTRSE